SSADVCEWLLEWAFAVGAGRSTGLERLELLRDGVLVDVDFTAKHDLQTGVQRVVRRLLPIWASAHDPQIAVWGGGSGALRKPTQDERTRIL
ncbi:hypothetical protein ACO1LI_13700, partial [Staphylococcus aureus]